MKLLPKLGSNPYLDVDRKYAIINALAFYAEFHNNRIKDMDFEYWQACFNADSIDLKEAHGLSVNDLSTQLSNYFP